jgi:hypothetical protein
MSAEADKGAPPSPPAKEAKEKQEKPDPQKSEQPESAQDDAAPESSAKDDRGAKESARRAAAAASNPGSTAEKLRQRKASHQNLNVGDSATFDNIRTQGGAFAGRDIVSNFYVVPPDADDTYEIGLDVRTMIGACYVEPPSFENLVSFCQDRSVSVIRVAPGQGKFATAVQLATAICSGSLHRLSAKKPLDQLGPDSIEENAGYVLTGLDQEQAYATLTRQDLARKAAELNQNEAKLVVAVSTETRLGQLTSTDYVTELLEEPAYRDVLKSHLTHRTSTATADRLLGCAELDKLVDDELAVDVDPRKAARLARLLAAAYREDLTDADVVAAAEQDLRRCRKQEFDDWFARLGGLGEYGFVIALAVLNGMPYEMVAHAGRLLEDKLTNPTHGNVQPLARNLVQPFRASLTARLAAFEAKQVRSALPTSGKGSAPGVAFKDPQRPGQVLLHVWREYGDAHWALVEWLCELGHHEVEEIRVRAGVAVGLLATFAWDYVQHSVIEPWANDRDDQLREVAAVAVDAINSVPALKERAHTLAQEWCRGTPRQIATGVRVYGGSVGLDHPHEMFDAFYEHAESTESIVLNAMCQSFMEIASAAVAGVSDKALWQAKIWATGRDRNRRLTGSLAFVYMAGDLLWSPPGTTETPEGRWPLLLRVANIGAEWRDLVAQLWAAALFESETADAAAWILDMWAEKAEPDEDRRTTFVRLLRATATSDRVLARLRLAVRGWAGTGKAVHAPLTAAALADLGRTSPEN